MLRDRLTLRRRGAEAGRQSRLGRAVIIMAIITSEILSACGVAPEEKESRAANALARKYNKEFEITEVYPQKFGELYYEVQAYAVDAPQLRFTAAVDTEDDGVSDTYVERLVCAAISQRISENLDALPGYYYVETQAVGPQPITEDAGISIADYAALDQLNRFQVELFVVPEGKDAQTFYDSLSNMFAGLDCLNGKVRLHVVRDEDMEAVQAYFEQNDKLGLAYLELTEDFFCLEVPYSAGSIAMSGTEFASAIKEVL